MAFIRVLLISYATFYFPQCVASPKAIRPSSHLLDLWVDDPLEQVNYDGPLMHYDMSTVESYFDLTSSGMAAEGVTFDGIVNRYLVELNAVAREATNSNAFGGPTASIAMSDDDRNNSGNIPNLDRDEPRDSVALNRKLDANATKAEIDTEDIGASEDIDEQATTKQAIGDDSMAAALNFSALSHDLSFHNEEMEGVSADDVASSAEEFSEDGQRDEATEAQAALTQNAGFGFAVNTQGSGQFEKATAFDSNSDAAIGLDGAPDLGVFEGAEDDEKAGQSDESDGTASIEMDEEVERASLSELESSKMDKLDINSDEIAGNDLDRVTPVEGEVGKGVADASQRDHIDDSEASDVFVEELHEKAQSTAGTPVDESTRATELEYQGEFGGDSESESSDAALEYQESLEVEPREPVDDETQQTNKGTLVDLDFSEAAVAPEVQSEQRDLHDPSGQSSMNLDGRGAAAESLQEYLDEEVDEGGNQHDTTAVVVEEDDYSENLDGDSVSGADEQFQSDSQAEQTALTDNSEKNQEIGQNEIAGVVLEIDEASGSSADNACEEHDDSERSESNVVLEEDSEASEGEANTSPFVETSNNVDASDEEPLEVLNKNEQSDIIAVSLEDGGKLSLPEGDFGGESQDQECTVELSQDDITSVSVEDEVGDRSSDWDQGNREACESEQAEVVDEGDTQSLAFIEGSDATGACDEEFDEGGDECDDREDADATELCEGEATESFEDVQLGDRSDESIQGDIVEAAFETSEATEESDGGEHADTADDQDDHCVDLEDDEVEEDFKGEVDPEGGKGDAPKSLGGSEVPRASNEEADETVNDISAFSKSPEASEELLTSTSVMPEVAHNSQESSQTEKGVDKGAEITGNGLHDEGSSGQDQECAAAWPGSLASGESLDQRSFLEVCQLIRGVCECAHAAVERSDAPEASSGDAANLLPPARFVMYTGKTPISPVEDQSTFDMSALGARPLVWSSSARLAAGSEPVDTDGIDTSAMNEKEHLSLVLHADGNLLLSRQFPRLKRREILWETSSGGEFSKYLLELNIDSRGPYFQISDIAESLEKNYRVIYSSRLGDVSLRRVSDETDLQDATAQPGLNWQEEWKSLKDNTKEELDNIRDASQGMRQGLGNLWNRFKKLERNGRYERN